MVNHIVNKLTLLACCLAFYLTGRTFTDDVLPVLLAIIFTCLLSYVEKEHLRIILTAAFTLCSLLLPWTCVFLPLICYDMLFSKKQWVCFLSLAPFLLFWSDAAVAVDIAICALFLLSALLKYRTAIVEQLKNDYYELRDTTQEMALRLKKQNQDLLKKQDNELTMATLGERNRIAREIHDNVGHLLSRALLQIGAFLAVKQDDQTKEALSTLKDTLSEAMDSIRTSVHDLHDESIDLRTQVMDLVHKFTFCPLRLDYSVQNKPGSKLNYALITIVKEALSNIVRHSDASQAEIRLREHPAFYQLIISDNGSTRNDKLDQGIGLKNINDRVEAFHGLLNIEIKKGFKLFISIPKKGN
ncbi:histidine kinase [Sporolactobacillus shoreicorticis]|uniref:histidine kinase n=1 Tax=Sporolactobacillus shoreicorticis TaxID=1923877 RepID=A0ABW5S634_9BACL|nr:histidine kinase [Sporolactobacillus shoreicorticis]MCO7126700.1 histidine kinase [Sporolactobacillus shoreicorticis]